MSRPRKFFSVTATAILIWGTLSSLIGFASSSQAEVIAQHLGAADPTAEGWAKIDQSNGAHIFAPVFNDLGTTDAWNIDTTNQGGDGKYRFYLNSTQVTDTLSRGWSLRARIRLLDVGVPAGQFLILRTGVYEYRLGFGTDTNGDPVVENTYVGDSVSVPGGAGLYHTYELRHSGASRAAELFIDGTLADASWLPYDYRITPAAVFGDVFGSRSIGGDANYAFVVFETVPEPSAGLLIVLGAGWLSLCHTRRGHNVTLGGLR